MWMTADDVASVLEVCRSEAYKIIKLLKDEMTGSGFFVNPNGKIPVKYFCDRFNLDYNEVKEMMNNREVRV